MGNVIKMFAFLQESSELQKCCTLITTTSCACFTRNVPLCANKTLLMKAGSFQQTASALLLGLDDWDWKKTMQIPCTTALISRCRFSAAFFHIPRRPSLRLRRAASRSFPVSRSASPGPRFAADAPPVSPRIPGRPASMCWWCLWGWCLWRPVCRSTRRWCPSICRSAAKERNAQVKKRWLKKKLFAYHCVEIEGLELLVDVFHVCGVRRCS